MTPYKIHQMWGSDSIKEPYGSYHRAIKELNPSGEVILWTDATMLDFMAEHYPDDLVWYSMLPLDIHRWDSFRYFLLYAVGGMYIDMDMQPTRSFQALFDEPLTLCTEHPKDAVRMGVDIIVSNAMMIAEPGHPFMGQIIEELRASKIKAEDCVLSATGPYLVTRVWKERLREVEPLNYQHFYPVDINSTHIPTRGVYATHKFASSWWQQTPPPKPITPELPPESRLVA